MTKRHVSLPDDARAGVEAFVDDVDRRLTEAEGHGEICDVVQEVLVDLFGDREAYDAWQEGMSVSPAERVRLQGYDPCNATLESEYYAEVALEEERFERSKDLQWLWRQFDATPMADNIEFALSFRQMLANHLFAETGENLRLFKGITFTYGHNIELGDNIVVHDDVHLDDRGKLTIGNRCSISDGAHIYSHDHDVVDQTEVRNYHTIVEDDARVTYDAMVRAGCRIGENAIVGARAVVQGDVPDHHIAVGMPARSVKVKPGFENEAEPIDDGRLANRQDEREIPYELPDDLDQFDEFQRPIDRSDTVQPHRR